MTNQLTSRERVLGALERRDIDRVPRAEGFWADTITRWQREGLDGGERRAHEILESDIASCTWCWPEPFPGEAQKLSEDAETITQLDTFGCICRYWKHRCGTPEHLGFTCTDRDVWREKFLPSFRRHPVQVNVDSARQLAGQARKENKFLVFQGAEPFEMLRRLLGDEGMAMALYDDVEWVREICEYTVEAVLSNYQHLIDAGVQPDGIWTFGDLAYTQAPFCSPQMYREHIWPWHVRMVEWARERNLKFIYHTDGDIRSLLDHLLAAGFDALHPLECKANMDIRKLAPTHGDRLTFFGNIDARVLSTNDPDLIDAEIAAKFAAGKAKNAYIYHSDHSIPPDVSWKTFLSIVKSIERHGAY